MYLENLSKRYMYVELDRQIDSKMNRKFRQIDGKLDR